MSTCTTHSAFYFVFAIIQPTSPHFRVHRRVPVETRKSPAQHSLHPSFSASSAGKEIKACERIPLRKPLCFTHRMIFVHNIAQKHSSCKRLFKSWKI
jgi:hypothetical protein